MTDQHADDNKLVAERRAKLDAIRAQCKSNGFPNSFRREDYADDLQAKLGEFDKPTLEEQAHTASIAGRIMAKRGYANHSNNAVTFNDFAITANLFNGCTNFHFITP